jgi:hypothetical protein
MCRNVLSMYNLIQVDGNSIYWEWHSDSSNEDWGFVLDVVGVCLHLQDSEKIKSELVNAGGAEPLLDFIAQGKDASLKTLATQSLSRLANNEKVRREVCSSFLLVLALFYYILRRWIAEAAWTRLFPCSADCCLK